MKASTAISNIRGATAERPGSPDSSSSTDEVFRLDGPSRPIDARIHAWRSDLADVALAGRIFAPHYARPIVRACGSQPAFVWPGALGDGDAISELLPGEEFAVLEYAGGRAWGFCKADHVVGYVEAIALADPIEPTHVVCERNAPVAADERVTSPVIAHLPMGARLHGHPCGGCLATEYGCVSMSHLRAFDDPEPDPVVVAERLLGVPWLPGGRSEQGIDAAGLVQLALGLAGIRSPRLPDQLRSFGDPVPDGARAERCDLVLFEGGAGLMIDDLMMIHASAESGRVTVEALALHPERRLHRLA
ncbi:MAG: NlpC/P60 family protein [Alphaproteobacteria bacterium]|nr:MAG: NlpC/P60 family protein [Alphaproteobacteria bacterium]